MPFIGQQPLTGAYSKLDSITTSATATYNLQLDSAAYSPASANHLLVSLNGVMQAPVDSFTVSGSTITFASALTSSDNIDFIMALGDVLNIGTPSDGTVTAAKIASSAVTTAKITDDNVTQAKIGSNAVGADQLYVTGNGTSGQALLSDADGTMSWGNVTQTISSWKLLYNSNTPVSFSSQGGTQLGSLDFYYPVSARIGGSFVKQYDAATSYIVTGGHYYAYSSSNFHSHWMWISGDEANSIHLGDDIYALSGEDGPSPRRKSKITIQSTFTGKAAGTYTIYTSSGSGDTRGHTGVLNANPGSTDGDTSNAATRSMFWAMEVLYT